MKMKKEETLTLVEKIKKTFENKNTMFTYYEVKSKLKDYGYSPRVELKIYLINYNVWDYFDLINIDKIFKKCGISDALTLGFITLDNESRLYFSYDIRYDKEEGK